MISKTEPLTAKSWSTGVGSNRLSLTDPLPTGSVRNMHLPSNTENKIPLCTQFWAITYMYNYFWYRMLLYSYEFSLLENTPLVKFIRNHIQDLGGVFSISSKDIDDFTGIKIALKFVSVWPKHIEVFIENLQKFQESSATFLWPSDKFWEIFGNLWKVAEIFRKFSKMSYVLFYKNVYIIKRT